MSIKLFLLGRPGSGKSTAFHSIASYVPEQFYGWSVTRFNDYQILEQMFSHQNLYPMMHRHKMFHATEHGGFDVVNFSVLDSALKNIEDEARKISSPKREELITIEFARDNYDEALKQFHSSFLEDAYFLFINADVKTCIQRVRVRVTEPPTLDNHFVSERILNGYYNKQHIPSTIVTNKGVKIQRSRVKVISSECSLNDFTIKVEHFIDDIFAHECDYFIRDEIHNNYMRRPLVASVSATMHKISYKRLVKLS